MLRALILLFFRLIDCLLPPDKRIDFGKKTFQPTTNPAFAAARERERIGIFLQKCSQYGIPDPNTFQTDYLYEKSNLVQVCTCIRALGIEVIKSKLFDTLIVLLKRSQYIYF